MKDRRTIVIYKLENELQNIFEILFARYQFIKFLEEIKFLQTVKSSIYTFDTDNFLLQYTPYSIELFFEYEDNNTKQIEKLNELLDEYFPFPNPYDTIETPDKDDKETIANLTRITNQSDELFVLNSSYVKKQLKKYLINLNVKL